MRGERASLLDGGASDDATPAPLRLALAWGLVAECLTAVLCPLVMSGVLDVTATALNIVGALVAGAVAAVHDAASDEGTRRACASFQLGFIGVFTSFSFMAEQAAQLAEATSCGQWCGWLYIACTVAAGCASFAAGRALLGTVLLRTQGRRRLRAPSPPALLRGLGAVVAAVWVWVLLSPAGAVFEPLAVHAARGATPSKRADVAHLGVGMAVQTAFLALSAAVGERARRRAARAAAGAVQWGDLQCNALACTLLLLVRHAEARGLLDDEHVLPIKLRTSGCGALSVSGGLAAMLVALASQRRRGRAAFNGALHCAVGVLACGLLPR